MEFLIEALKSVIEVFSTPLLKPFGIAIIVFLMYELIKALFKKNRI